MGSKKSLLAAAPLFLVLFIDGMGLGLLFPILNSIIIDVHTPFLPMGTSLATRDFYYGLVVGIFMFAWFFGAAILGDLSDTVGRKKALLICLLGSATGYFLSAVGILFHSVSILILGRIVAGFTSGSQPIAQAAIVDVSTEENKARNIGLILLALSLGFVFGPVIGGVLSDHRVVSWFTFATPMYFAALISLANAALLLIFFHETFKITDTVKIRIHRAITIFVSAFQHTKVRALSVVFFVFIFGWSNFFSFSAMFMLNRYHLAPIYISFYLGVMGLGFSVGCGLLVDMLCKHFPMKIIVIFGTLLTVVCILGTILFKSQVVAWVMVFFIGVAIALAYSVIISLFSNQVDENEQGWVMGVTGSILALSFAVTTFFTGFIAQHGAEMPLILAAFGLTLSALFMMPVRLASNVASID